jgi:hypothetical protein
MLFIQWHAYYSWWAEGRLVGGRRGNVENIIFAYFKLKQANRGTEFFLI